jgi:tetratricopeptide (TPR) repeat protein
MNRAMRPALVALAAILALSVSGEAGSRAGSAAGHVLLHGNAGARSAALGGAYVAVAEGPLTLRYNPAGLAAADRKRLFLQYDASIAEINRTDGVFAFPWWSGGAAFGISFVDYGSMIRTTTANKTGAGTFGANDFLVRLGYGRPAGDRVDLGASIGFYQLRIDDGSASGLTADLGALYRLAVPGLTIGAAIRNIGTRVKFQTDLEDLPLALTLGASYRPDEKWLITAEYEAAKAGDHSMHAGLEYSPVDILALRIGYDGRNEAGSGLTLGGGFKVNDLTLDYAYVPFGELGAMHKFTAEWAFGPTTSKSGARTSIQLLSPPKPLPAPVVEKAEPPISSHTTAPQQPPTTTPSSPTRQWGIPELLAEAERAGRLGEANEQERLFREVVRLDPGHPLALYNLASLRYLDKSFQEARDLYDKVVTLTPADVEAWLYLGICEERLNRPRDAQRVFRRVLELEPANVYARQRIMEMNSR